jgi:hypothetical protein
MSPRSVGGANVKAWEYCWAHWSTGDVGYLTEEGELKEFPTFKNGAIAVANLGLVGWELVNVQHDMFYFKREKLPEHDRLGSTESGP